jgi:hypothetical protein
MSHDEIIDASIREEAYRSMRMLAWSLAFVAILLSPVVVLTAVLYGWKEIEWLIYH